MLIKEHLFDKRVVKRALQEGRLDKQEYQRALDALPDLSHRVQASESAEEPRVSTHDTTSSSPAF